MESVTSIWTSIGQQKSWNIRSNESARKQGFMDVFLKYDEVNAYSR